MRDVVVIRPMNGVVYAKCPFCNLETWLDRSGAFHAGAQFKCEGCGAIFGEQLVAIHSLRHLVDSDNLQDNDITTIMANDTEQENKIILAGSPSPVMKIKMERSVFYVASVVCSFCAASCMMRYNAINPFPAQWCPTCGAELVATIWANLEVGGNLQDWYQADPEETSA